MKAQTSTSCAYIWRIFLQNRFFAPSESYWERSSQNSYSLYFTVNAITNDAITEAALTTVEMTDTIYGSGGMMGGHGGMGGMQGQGGHGGFRMERAQGGNAPDAQSSATTDAESSATV